MALVLSDGFTKGFLSEFLMCKFLISITGIVC